MARAALVLGAAAVVGLLAGDAAAASLYAHPAAVTADDNGLGEDLPGLVLSRTDASADTLYFRFVVRPASGQSTETYAAGFDLFRDASTPGLGVGNPLASVAYGATGTSTGDLDLLSGTPEPGQTSQWVRVGDVCTLVMRVRYTPGGLDDVTVWLNPDSTLTEAQQPLARTTTFTADASFTGIHLRENGGGAGWTFSRIAIGTRMSDVFGPLPFTNVTTPAMADTGLAEGVAWQDVDGDGDLDLVVSDLLSANLLFRNDDGTLDPSPDTTLGGIGATQGVTWGDVDNDGDLDAYLANYGAPNQLMRNDGPLGFTDVTVGPLADAGASMAAVWGDMDNDGDLDLYVVNFDGTNRLLRNDGGTFTDATTAPLAGQGQCTSAAWGDYDGDGDLDLYVASFGLSNRLLRNDGGGAFTDVTSGPLGDSGHSFGVAWGDYDDDGDLDLFVVNNGSSCRLLRNDGGAFTDVTGGPLAVNGAAVGVAWGDVDNDGDLDLYVTCYGEPNHLLRNEGGDVFTEAGGPLLADASFGTGAAWGDYDADGDLDLFVANEGLANDLFRNDEANGAHWLQVRLHGTSSNRAGIGARVRLVAGGRTQVREISGGSGYGSQEPLVAEFGLGATTKVDSLLVHWPSGILQLLVPTPTPDQVLTVTEPPSTLAVDDGSMGALLLAPAWPNPFRASTTLAFDLPRPSRVRMTVEDVQGRQVAVLADGPSPAGHHVLAWTGQDGGGRRLGPGLYLVRLETASGGHHAEQTRKLVLAR